MFLRDDEETKEEEKLNLQLCENCWKECKNHSKMDSLKSDADKQEDEMIKTSWGYSVPLTASEINNSDLAAKIVQYSKEHFPDLLKDWVEDACINTKIYVLTDHDEQQSFKEFVKSAAPNAILVLLVYAGCFFLFWLLIPLMFSS